MDAGAVETIAKMQCKIDNYEYFLQNLFIKLTNQILKYYVFHLEGILVMLYGEKLRNYKIK